MFSIFCRHEWELLSETVTKSDLESIVLVCRGAFEINSKADAGNRKHIAICTCKKCGKLKRFVERL